MRLAFCREGKRGTRTRNDNAAAAKDKQEKAAIDACEDKAAAACDRCEAATAKLPFPLNIAAADMCEAGLLIRLEDCQLHLLLGANRDGDSSSKEMITMSHHRFIIMVFTAVAIAMTVGALSPVALAQEGLRIKDDDIKIDFGTADFGAPPHAFGSPVKSGGVAWFFFSTEYGGFYAEALVDGVLFLDSLDPGCARLTIEFKSGSGAILATRNKDVCVTAKGHNANDSTNQALILEDFHASDLNQVVFRTHSVVNGLIVSTSPAFTSTAPNSKNHNVIINSDSADFGKGFHAGGGPTGSALVQLKRDNGNVKGLVSGTLYYDNLLSEGCAQIIILFENSSGSALKTVTVKKCGPGGNANDDVNKKTVDETFTSGSLFRIRLRVGQVLQDESFIKVKKKLCDFKECKDL
jgi:hypothetical protein